MMRRAIRSAAVAIVVLAFAGTAESAEPIAASGPAGELPRGLDGQPLNLDFERGTLEHWAASGEAFSGQPVEGDTVTARGRGMKSEHAGRFWIGGFERTKSDQPQGTLTSAPFKVSHVFASFRIAGGSSRETRVELVRQDTGKVIFQRSGDDTETLKPVVVDLFADLGKEN